MESVLWTFIKKKAKRKKRREFIEEEETPARAKL
jgi:hypothetical protein